MSNLDFSGKNRTKLMVLALSFSFLTACSAKFSSDAPPAGPSVPSKVGVDQVAAIPLDGVWAGDCEMEPHGQGQVKVTLTIKGHDFSRAMSYFSDYSCKVPNGSETLAGTFSFQTLKADNVYEVEYLVKTDMVTPSFQPYRMPGNIKRTEDKMWVTLLANADGAPHSLLKLVK